MASPQWKRTKPWWEVVGASSPSQKNKTQTETTATCRRKSRFRYDRTRPQHGAGGQHGRRAGGTEERRMTRLKSRVSSSQFCPGPSLLRGHRAYAFIQHVLRAEQHAGSCM